jgi:transposase
MSEGDTMTTVTGPDGKDYPTGDLEPLLRCSGPCRALLPISQFHFNNKNENRFFRAGMCKGCKSDIERRRRNGEPTLKAQRMAARREQVLPLARQHYLSGQIAEMLGVSRSVITSDLRYFREEGLLSESSNVAARPNVVVADNVIQQLDELAHLVHDGRRVILQLEGLPIDPDMAGDWEKRLHHVGQALRYLRSHAKKGNTT